MPESIITISELEAVTTAPNSSYIPIDNGSVTNKISVENFNASSTTSATNQALKSEGYAVGKQNGEDVSSDSPYYQNSAKYYRDDANTIKTAVLTQVQIATEAASDATTAKNSALSSAGNAASSASLADSYADAASDSASSAATSATSAASSATTASSAAASATSSAADALSYKDSAIAAKTAAEEAATEAAEASVRTPYIGANGNWFVWDSEADDYVDSGEYARGEQGEPGSTPSVSATATVTQPTGITNVNVTRTGTTESPVFNFAFSGIKGDPGAKGDPGETGPAGTSPNVEISTIAGGHEVTIYDKYHPSGQSFDVMDGAGNGDMLSSTYDPNSAVAQAGGIPSYVNSQVNGKADKVQNATGGDIAVLTNNGNLASSGLNFNNGYIRPFDDSVNQWDTSPTNNSKKVVTSGGVYESIYGTNGAIQQSIDSVMHGLDPNGTVVLAGGITSYVNGQTSGKLDKYTAGSSAWDTTPTANSTKPVTSGGVYAAVDNATSSVSGKLDKYSSGSADWDTTPTNSSNKAITSGGVYTNTVRGVQAATSSTDGQVGVTTTKGTSSTSTYAKVCGWDKLVGKWTDPVSVTSLATSVILINPYNSASVDVDPYCERSSGKPVAYRTISVTASTITLTFDALGEAGSFKARVTLNS